MLGRTAAAAVGGAAGPDGTPGPETVRGPSHVGYGHQHPRSGANGANPAKPSKVTSSDSAAGPADGTGHLLAVGQVDSAAAAAEGGPAGAKRADHR